MPADSHLEQCLDVLQKEQPTNHVKSLPQAAYQTAKPLVTQTSAEIKPVEIDIGMLEILAVVAVGTIVIGEESWRFFGMVWDFVTKASGF